MTSDPLLSVLHEDEHLLLLDKPAGLVCHPTKKDARSSLIGRIRLHLGENIRPHLINRLDRETSGVVLVAKSTEAARTIRLAFELRQVTKIYLAVVHGWIEADEGLCQVSLGPDETSEVSIKDRVRDDGAPACTRFRVLSRFSRAQDHFSYLEVRPVTGRKHQIRIHLAHMGHPIVGDKMYGKDPSCYLAMVKGQLTPGQREVLITPYHALVAHRLELEWQGQARFFQADPEPWFMALLRGQEVPWSRDMLTPGA